MPVGRASPITACDHAGMTPSAHPHTVILVHGAWHGGWCWAALQAELDRRGVPSLAVDLPGHGASLEPFGDLHGDAAAVHAVAARVVGPVVLVGHSYGGAVITEAAVGLPGVAHLVYLAAFCLDEGEAVRRNNLPHGGRLALDDAFRAGEDGFASIDPAGATAAFYGSCPPEVAAAATARLGRQPMAAFTQAVRAAAWRTIPSTYVVCERDQAIHPETQRSMAARCTTTVTLDTDHSPFASMAVETADVIEPLTRT